jgi:hypothetical protein
MRRAREMLRLNMILVIIGGLLVCVFTYACLIPWARFRLYARRMPERVHVSEFVPVLGSSLLYKYRRGEVTHLEYVRRRFGRYNPECRAALSNLMLGNFLLLFSPEYLAEFYRNLQSFEKDGMNRRLLGFVTGRGLLVLEGEEHRQERHLLAKVFSFQFLTNSTPKINRLIESRVSGLQSLGHF